MQEELDVAQAKAARRADTCLEAKAPKILNTVSIQTDASGTHIATVPAAGFVVVFYIGNAK